MADSKKIAKRIHYTASQVDKILTDHWCSGLSVRSFGLQVHVNHSELLRWLNKEASNTEPAPRKKSGPLSPALEDQLHEWLLLERSKGPLVANANIRSEVNKTTCSGIRYLGFVASDKWTCNFKKRKWLSYRTPTHTSLKDTFGEKDQEELEMFFTDAVEVVIVEGVPLADLLSFDQTNVRFVAPQPKTLSLVGLKEVNVTHPPGEKEGITVAHNLCRWQKLPAMAVFKGSPQTGVLSASRLKKLKVPNNIIVQSSRKALVV